MVGAARDVGPARAGAPRPRTSRCSPGRAGCSGPAPAAAASTRRWPAPRHPATSAAGAPHRGGRGWPAPRTAAGDSAARFSTALTPPVNSSATPDHRAPARSPIRPLLREHDRQHDPGQHRGREHLRAQHADQAEETWCGGERDAGQPRRPRRGLRSQRQPQATRALERDDQEECRPAPLDDPVGRPRAGRRGGRSSPAGTGSRRPGSAARRSSSPGSTATGCWTMKRSTSEVRSNFVSNVVSPGALQERHRDQPHVGGEHRPPGGRTSRPRSPPAPAPALSECSAGEGGSRSPRLAR